VTSAEGWIEIDGGHGSGSGTLVRFAVAFAAVLGRRIRVVRARAKREKPGLRPQHVAAVRAAAALCDGEAEGVSVGARSFTFAPGRRVRGGELALDIGTAGSATMLALGLLPIICLAEKPTQVRITGGVFQDFAPSPHHLEHVLAPLLGRMGAGVSLEVVRAGYVPRGEGVLALGAEPAAGGLAPLRLEDPGVLKSVRGVAFSSHLEPRRVSERMARSCVEGLSAAGVACEIDEVLDRDAAGAGASLAVWATTSSGCLLGADRAGALRRSAEAIGRFVADTLLEDLRTGATVDRHLADQLVPFAALAAGRSVWIAPRVTDHLATNLWLAERFGARVRLQATRVEIEGVGAGLEPTSTS